MSILGISKTTFYRYLKSGKLRAAHDGRTIGAYEDEVYQLKKSLDDPFPIAVSRVTLSAMLARIQTLELRVATLSKILDVRYEPLNMTEPEYRSLYESSKYFSEHGWPPQAEQQLADIFLRIKPEDFERMSEATKEEHPWQPVLRLVHSMYLRPFTPELRDMFSAGLNNVNAIAGIYCTLKGATPKSFDLMVDRHATPDPKLMKKLGKTRLDS